MFVLYFFFKGLITFHTCIHTFSGKKYFTNDKISFFSNFHIKKLKTLEDVKNSKLLIVAIANIEQFLLFLLTMKILKWHLLS